jgi:hypothetical protein
MLLHFFNGVCIYNYEDILFRLNLLTPQLGRRHLDALFLINVFIGNICCSSILDSVSLRILSRSIRHYSTFTVNRNFKVSPSARCVSAATAVCRSIDILNKDCISLTDISQPFQLICSSFSYKYLYICYCILLCSLFQCLSVIGYSAVVKHVNKVTELNWNEIIIVPLLCYTEKHLFRVSPGFVVWRRTFSQTGAFTADSRLTWSSEILCSDTPPQIMRLLLRSSHLFNV